jgi:hypothetical protein
MRAKAIGMCSLLALVSGAAAGHAHGDHGADRVSKPPPEELSAFARAKPIFEQHCFRCHTTSGKKSKRKAMEHMNMNGYPFEGHHAGEAGQAIRKVLGIGRPTKPTMPSDDPGAVKGDALAKIAAWADAYEHAHTHETTKPKEIPHAH